MKHDSYFPVYEELLGKFIGSNVVLVEIGVLNGGSLFMWREYLDASARIIGVDFNPSARRWQDFGFETHIGDQADPSFWRDFLNSIGSVHVVLDDGGHSNVQQIATAHHCMRHVNNGGMIIVEAVHASYLPEFGNPSKYSLLNFSKRIVDAVNGGFPNTARPENSYGKHVHSVSYFTSTVAFLTLTLKSAAQPNRQPMTAKAPMPRIFGIRARRKNGSPNFIPGCLTGSARCADSAAWKRSRARYWSPQNRFCREWKAERSKRFFR